VNFLRIRAAREIRSVFTGFSEMRALSSEEQRKEAPMALPKRTLVLAATVGALAAGGGAAFAATHGGSTSTTPNGTTTTPSQTQHHCNHSA